jgi:hypothetical protein
VRLEEHQVAPVLAAQALAGMEEVVEAHLEQIGRAGVAGDVAAQLAIGLVGAHHHGQRVPAHDGGEPLLHRQIAGEHGLLLHGHGVHVGRVQAGLPAQRCARHARQLVEHEARALGAFGGHQGEEGLAPFGGFLGSVSSPAGRTRAWVGWERSWRHSIPWLAKQGAVLRAKWPARSTKFQFQNPTQHMKLDAIDLRILAELQADGSLSNVELARRVHLRPRPAWRV